VTGCRARCQREISPKNKPRKLCLPSAFMLVSCFAYSSTLRIEAICFSETSVVFFQLAGKHSACHLLSRCYLARLIGRWRWRRYVPPKRLLTFSRLHGIMSQKIEPFKSSVNTCEFRMVVLTPPHENI
jgi:hypothetical protein